MAGFIPIGFARSSAGEYTYSIFVVVSAALVLSWFVAVIFAPLLCAVLLRPKVISKGSEPGRVMRLYRGFLVGAMRARWLTIGVSIVLFGAALWASQLVPRQFFPPSDRVELLVDLTLPQNASIYATEEAVDRLEALLADDPDVERWSSYIGRGAIRFYLPLNVQLANPFFAQLVVIARDLPARQRLQPRLEALLAEQFPELVARVSPLELGPPVGWPVQYRVSGPDLTEVRRIALDLAEAVATHPAARRINFDWMEPAREVRIQIDQDEARHLGAELGGGRLGPGQCDQRCARDPGAGRHLSGRRGRSLDRGGARSPSRQLRNLQVPLAGAVGAIAITQFAIDRVRSGVPAGLASRPRPDTHRPGRRGAGDPAGSVVDDARVGDRGAERGAAAALPDRGRRHRGGERRVAGFGRRRRSDHALRHVHPADDPAAELPAPLPGAERGAAGPDRRDRRAAPLRVDRSASWRSSASSP